MSSRRIRIASCSLLLVAVMAAHAPVATSAPAAARVIVTFRSGTRPVEQAHAIATMGGVRLRTIDESRAAVRLNGRARAAVTADPRVATVEPDAVYHAAIIPNDPCYVNCFSFTQWGLAHIGAPAAWDVTTGTSAPIRVAVLDTGVDATHPDLGGRVTRSSNFSSSFTAQDVKGHGTLVAGVVAATGNNATGIAGVSWGAEIRSFKVLDDDGSGWASDIAAALRAAADEGARVVNMSFAGPSFNSVLADAVAYTEAKGAVLVAAAGNATSTTPVYPAAYNGVVAVAATDSSDGLASFSNRGSWITLAAPGTAIPSTSAGGGYQSPSGTSFAAPIVAGAAALLWLTTNGPNAASIRSRLIATAQPIGTDAGAGLLQVGAALAGAELVGPCAPSTSGYVLDGWGGVHAASGAPLVTNFAYWKGWDIARDLVTRTGGGGWVLDGWGGLHPFGSAQNVTASAYWRGWDIARAVTRLDTGGGYVLDGWGGLHPFDGAPAVTASAYWKGWDIARDVVSMGGGGYVLDGWGGLHPFGDAPAVAASAYWYGSDIARRIVLDDTGTKGWVLDVNGGMHPFAPVGTTPPTSLSNPLAPQVPARDGFVGPADAGFFITGQGSVAEFGAPACAALPTWPGWDIARAFAPAL